MSLYAVERETQNLALTIVATEAVRIPLSSIALA
jgi:hypothetical protein